MHFLRLIVVRQARTDSSLIRPTNLGNSNTYRKLGAAGQLSSHLGGPLFSRRDAATATPFAPPMRAVQNTRRLIGLVKPLFNTTRFVIGVATCALASNHGLPMSWVAPESLPAKTSGERSFPS